MLNGVVDGQSSDDRPAGRVDIQVDWLVGLFVVEVLCKVDNEVKS